MASAHRDHLKEAASIVFCSFLIAGSFVVLNDLSDMKKSAFDFLASASVPTFLCWVVICLATILILRSALNLYLSQEGEPPDDQKAKKETIKPENLAQFILLALISLAYVATINFSLMPFAVSTPLMLAGSMLVLSPRTNWNLGLIAFLSVSVGGGCAYIFTQVLPLPFPGF